jgi:hypothetical protein
VEEKGNWRRTYLKEIDNFEDLNVDGRYYLSGLLSNRVAGCETDFEWPRIGTGRGIF